MTNDCQSLTPKDGTVALKESAQPRNDLGSNQLFQDGRELFLGNQNKCDASLKTGGILSDLEIGDSQTSQSRTAVLTGRASDHTSGNITSSGANSLDFGDQSQLYKRDLFNSLDLNQSGSLNRNELAQDVVKNLLRIDKNDDGSIDLQELRQDAKSKGMPDVMADIGFWYADGNRDGKIDSAEMQKIGQGVADFTMYVADKNRDNQLNFEEFEPLVGPDTPPGPTPPKPHPPGPEPRPEPGPEPKPEPGPDVPPEPKPPGPDVPSDQSVEASRKNFKDAIDDYLSPEAMQRMDKMMQEFEERGAERVDAQVAGGQDRGAAEKEWSQKISNTYKELTEMVSSDSPTAVYDKATRAKLAENAMYLVMNPANENQGQHGTCWIEAEINMVGLGKHPDKMADLLNQVATTGSYTDINGQKHNVPKQLLQFTGEEANWTIANAGNGLRSPAGALFDRTLSYCGSGRTDGGTNGGTLQEAEHCISLACGEAAKVVQIRDNYLTDSDIRNITSGANKQAMLEDGGVILLGPGHMFSSRLVNENGQWQIIGDNQWGPRNDQLIGRIGNLSNWNVQNTREQYVPDHGQVGLSSDRPIGVRSSSTSNSTGYGINVYARGDNNQRVFDDTNSMIQGPWGAPDLEISSCDSVESNECVPNTRIDRAFHLNRYLETRKRMDEEWQKRRESLPVVR